MADLWKEFTDALDAVGGAIAGAGEAVINAKPVANVIDMAMSPEIWGNTFSINPGVAGGGSSAAELVGGSSPQAPVAPSALTRPTTQRLSAPIDILLPGASEAAPFIFGADPYLPSSWGEAAAGVRQATDVFQGNFWDMFNPSKDLFVNSIGNIVGRGGQDFDPQKETLGFNWTNVKNAGIGIIGMMTAGQSAGTETWQELQVQAALDVAMGKEPSNWIGASLWFNLPAHHLMENPGDLQEIQAILNSPEGYNGYKGVDGAWEFIIGKQPWAARLAMEGLNDPTLWATLALGVGGQIVKGLGSATTSASKPLVIGGRAVRITDSATGAVRVATQGDLYFALGRGMSRTSDLIDIASDPVFNLGSRGAVRLANNVLGRRGTSLGQIAGTGARRLGEQALRLERGAPSWLGDPIARRLDGTNYGTLAADTVDAGLTATTDAPDIVVEPPDLQPWEKPVAGTGVYTVIKKPGKSGDAYVVDVVGRPVGIRDTGTGAADRLQDTARQLNERAARTKRQSLDQWMAGGPTRIQDTRQLGLSLLLDPSFQSTELAQVTPAKMIDDIEAYRANAAFNRVGDFESRDRIDAWYQDIGLQVQRDAGGQVIGRQVIPGSRMDKFLSDWVALEFQYFDEALDGGLVNKILQQQALINGHLGYMMRRERELVGRAKPYVPNETVEHYRQRYGVDVPLDANGQPDVNVIIGLWREAASPGPQEAMQAGAREAREKTLFALTQDLANRVAWGSNADAAAIFRAVGGRYGNQRARDRYGNNWLRDTFLMLREARQATRPVAPTQFPDPPVPGMRADDPALGGASTIPQRRLGPGTTTQFSGGQPVEQMRPVTEFDQPDEMVTQNVLYSDDGFDAPDLVTESPTGQQAIANLLQARAAARAQAPMRADDLDGANVPQVPIGGRNPTSMPGRRANSPDLRGLNPATPMSGNSGTSTTDPRALRLLGGGQPVEQINPVTEFDQPDVYAQRETLYSNDGFDAVADPPPPPPPSVTSPKGTQYFPDPKLRGNVVGDFEIYRRRGAAEYVVVDVRTGEIASGPSNLRDARAFVAAQQPKPLAALRADDPAISGRGQVGLKRSDLPSLGGRRGPQDSMRLGVGDPMDPLDPTMRSDSLDNWAEQPMLDNTLPPDDGGGLGDGGAPMDPVNPVEPTPMDGGAAVEPAAPVTPSVPEPPVTPVVAEPTPAPVVAEPTAEPTASSVEQLPDSVTVDFQIGNSSGQAIYHMVEQVSGDVAIYKGPGPSNYVAGVLWPSHPDGIAFGFEVDKTGATIVGKGKSKAKAKAEARRLANLPDEELPPPQSLKNVEQESLPIGEAFRRDRVIGPNNTEYHRATAFVGGHAIYQKKKPGANAYVAVNATDGWVVVASNGTLVSAPTTLANAREALSQIVNIGNQQIGVPPSVTLDFNNHMLSWEQGDNGWLATVSASDPGTGNVQKIRVVPAGNGYGFWYDQQKSAGYSTQTYSTIEEAVLAASDTLASLQGAAVINGRVVERNKSAVVLGEAKSVEAQPAVQPQPVIQPTANVAPAAEPQMGTNRFYLPKQMVVNVGDSRRPNNHVFKLAVGLENIPYYIYEEGDFVVRVQFTGSQDSDGNLDGFWALRTEDIDPPKASRNSDYGRKRRASDGGLDAAMGDAFELLAFKTEDPVAFAKQIKQSRESFRSIDRNLDEEFYSGVPVGPTVDLVRGGAQRAGRAAATGMMQLAGVATPSAVTPGIDPGATGMRRAVEQVRERGTISEQQAALLTQTMPGQTDRLVIDEWATLVRSGKSNEQAWVEIAGQIREWGNLSRRDRQAVLRGDAAAVAKYRANISRTSSALNQYLEIVRDQMMYNPISAARNAVQDMAGNMTHLLLNGDLTTMLAFYDQTGPEKLAWMVRNPKSFAQSFTRDSDPVLRAAGISLPSEVVNSGAARAGMDSTDELLLRQKLANRPIGSVAAKILQSQYMKELRQGVDTFGRGGLMIAKYLDGHALAVSRLKSLMTANGLDADRVVGELLQAAKVRTGDPDVVTFSVQDLHAVMRGQNVPRETKFNLARAWREEQQLLINDGRKAVADAFFVGKRSSGGNSVMSKLFYFHFWMTQSSSMHIKRMVASPKLMNAYVNMWNGAKEEAERNGYPPTFTGMLSFYSDPATGMLGLWNPIGLVAPAFMFESAFDGEERGFFEQLLELMPITPVFAGALAALGKTDNVPDLFGTRGNFEKAAYAVGSWLESKGIDITGGGAKPMPQIVEEATARAFELVNEAAQVAGAEDVNFYTTSEGRSDVFASILMNEAEQKFGPMTTWTAEEWDEYRLAYESIKTGSKATPLASRVQDIYANQLLGITTANFLIPGGMTMRFGPRDDVRAADKKKNRDAEVQRNLARATGQAGGLIIEQQTARAGASEAMGPDAMYWVDAYENIRDGFRDETQFRADDWILIGGQKVTVGEIRALPETQQQALADRWMAERNVTPIWSDFEEARKTAEQLVPGGQVRDFRAYQQMVYDFKDGQRGFRAWARNESPNFAAAEADYRQYLEREGRKGAVLEVELDNWAVSRGAYQAFIGKQREVYDADPLGTGQANAVLGVAKTNQPAYGPERTQDLVARDLARARVQNQLAQLGIFGQLMGVDTSPYQMQPATQMYMDWAAARPGRDNSPQMFQQWLTTNGMTNRAADRLPAYFQDMMAAQQ